MRVLLNCESLRPPLTGIGNYTAQLLRCFRSHPDVKEVLCYAAGRLGVNAEDLLGETQPETSQARRGGAMAAVKAVVRSVPGAYELRSLLGELQFRRDARLSGAGIYHEPNYILKPFSGPMVTTVHDVSHIRFPQYHPRERVKFLERRLPGTLKRADMIITVSEFTRRELIEVADVPPERVVAIPLAAGPQFRARDAVETAETLERLGLAHGRYVLTVATFEPRKNLAGLLRAYRLLDRALRREYPLVLVGAPGWRTVELQRDIDRAVSDGDVRFLGYLPTEELAQVYSGAAAFAYVSHYEGFGLPILEAMKSGVPVLTSDCTSMPEVAADAALYAGPGCTEEIRDRLCQLLDSHEVPKMLADRGVQRAALFNWEQTADRTVDVYRQAIGRFSANGALRR